MTHIFGPPIPHKPGDACPLPLDALCSVTLPGHDVYTEAHHARGWDWPRITSFRRAFIKGHTYPHDGSADSPLAVGTRYRFTDCYGNEGEFYSGGGDWSNVRSFTPIRGPVEEADINAFGRNLAPELYAPEPAKQASVDDALLPVEGLPWKVEAFNIVIAGHDDCSAMILASDGISIVAQCLRDDTAEFICEIANAYPASLASHPEAATIETWESINKWCDDTFGPATVSQIVERAKEEFTELEDVTDNVGLAAIEAADVVICLCRTPGFAEALQRKMGINRKRKWRLVGNGTGYHIPDDQAWLKENDRG